MTTFSEDLHAALDLQAGDDDGRTTTDGRDGRTEDDDDDGTDDGRTEDRTEDDDDDGTDDGRRRRATDDGRNLTFQIRHWGQNSNQNLFLHQTHFSDTHSNFNPKTHIKFLTVYKIPLVPAL